MSTRKRGDKAPATHQKKALQPEKVPAEPKQNPWVEMIRHYIKNPVDFVKDQLCVTPDDWQGDVLMALAKYDRVAVRSGHGVGKCVTNDSAILLSDGSYVRAGDLIGKTAFVPAWYPDGTMASALAYFTDNGVQPVWRIRTRLGRIIDRTGNHPFLTIDGWKAVEDLRVGDSLAMPTTLPVEGNQRMNEDELKVLAHLDAHAKFIPDAVFRVPNDQVALFLNRLFATDGWVYVNEKTGRVEIGYTSVSRELIEGVQRLLLRLGIVGRIRKKRTTWTHNGQKKESTAWVWEIHSADAILSFAEKVGIYGREEELARCVEVAKKREQNQTYTQGYRTWPEQTLSIILREARKQGVPLALLRNKLGIRHRNRPIRMSSEYVANALAFVDIPFFKALCRTNVGWDVVESIEYLGEMPTVAVTVPGPETYIVDLIEHNTALEVFAKYWFLFTRPHARVPCTAPSRPQLEDVLWPESAKWLQQSKIAPYFRWTKTKVFFVGFEETWFATMRTAAKPENMQGFHGDHMLWILDEASGLEDEITEVIEGSLTGGQDNKILMCGNPTQLSGLFYRAFHQEADLWCGFKISCLDSPRVSRSYIEKMRRFGEDSDIYRVRVLGEFPKGGLDTFLPFGEVYKATYRDVPEGSPVEMGIDVARFGDDETVFAIRKGLKLLPLEAHGGWDTVRTAERAVELAIEHHVTRIKVDDTGVGGGVTDNLRRLQRENKLPRHVQIVPVNNGAKGDEYYENVGAMAWGHFKEILPFISLPKDDEELIAQLTDRRKRMTTKGKIALEPKSEMKARGKRSPDRADAAVLAFFEADIPNVSPVAVNRAFALSANLWAPSRWKVV